MGAVSVLGEGRGRGSSSHEKPEKQAVPESNFLKLGFLTCNASAARLSSLFGA